METAQSYVVEPIRTEGSVAIGGLVLVDPNEAGIAGDSVETPILTQQDYKDALLSQNACNLSGLAHSLATLTSRIWGEANQRKQGTEWVNRHPLIRLYLEQMVFLNCGSMIDGDSYRTASAFCRKMAGEKFEVGSIVAEELAALIEAYG